MINKLKIIEIKRSRHGDLYGLVDGKVKYQSSTNTINIGRPKGNISVRFKPVFSFDAIKVIRGSDCILTTTEGVSGQYYSEGIYYPYVPNLQVNFITFGHFIKNHWKEGLTIGTTVWTFFREFGILAIPTTRFFKM